MSEDQSSYRDFHWEMPEHFNFGATIDAFGAEPGRPAILCEDQDGNRARLCFADIREQSNRIANVLTGLGVKPGDPVIIVLPRITLWQAAYVGALKAGAIVIPCVSTLREKDLIYRANHSGAVAIIAAIESADLVGDLRNQMSLAQALYRRGQPAHRMARFAGLDGDERRAGSSPVRTRASDPAICFYTSGTAKEPKAVLHSHAYTWCHRYTGSHGSTCGRANCTGPPRIRDGPRRAYGVLFGPWMNGVTTFMYNGALRSAKATGVAAAAIASRRCARRRPSTGAGDRGSRTPRTPRAAPLHASRRSAQSGSHRRLA